jgi:hypothetical protein
VEAGGEPGVYFFGGALEGRLVFGAKHVRPKENVCRKEGKWRVEWREGEKWRLTGTGTFGSFQVGKPA